MQLMKTKPLELSELDKLQLFIVLHWRLKFPCEFRKMHHHLSHSTKFRCAEGFSSIFSLWKLFRMAPNQKFMSRSKI